MDHYRTARSHATRFLCIAKTVASRTLHSASKIINYIVIGSILAIRPLLGPPARCRYPLTCTPYAIQQLQEKNIFAALWNITKRLLSCNPFW